MFKEIFIFELRRAFKTPATYIYFFLMLGLSFLVFNISGDAFKSVSISNGEEKVLLNSPFALQMTISVFCYLGIILIGAIMGNAIYNDYKYRIHPLIFTTSVSKFNYIFSRFSASVIISLFVFTGPAFGVLLGTQMPYLNQDKIGEFVLLGYLQPYFTTVIPNILFIGSILFTLGMLVRNMLVNWVAIILIYVIYGVSQSLLGDLDNETLVALLDPLGITATELSTRYWTVDEKNNLTIPFQGVLLFNRIIWLLAGFGILLFGYFKYGFTQHAISFSLFKRKKKNDLLIKPNQAITFSKLEIPIVSKSYNTVSFISRLFSLAYLEFKQLIKSVYFKIILLIGLLFVFLVAGEMGKMYDTETYPVTYMVIGYISGTLKLFIFIITVLFAGELIWKERDLKMEGIYDALPIPNWLAFGTKLTALIFVQFLLSSIIVVSGVLIQLFKGYFSIDFALYVQEIFGMHLIDYVLLAILAITVQVIVNNKYVGYFIMALYFVWESFFALSLLKHNLLVFGSDSGFRYSDMNEFGHFLFPYYMYKIYWLSFAIILALVSNLLWVRGSEANLKTRFKALKTRINKPAVAAFAMAIAVFIGSGGFIYYNTNILNKFETAYDGELLMVEYEKKYKQYEHLAQPKITDVKISLALYPNERSSFVKGAYTIKNKTNNTIDSIHLFIPEQVKIKDINFENRKSKLVHEDKKFSYYIYKLQSPMNPGESIRLNFQLAHKTDGFTHTTGTEGVIYNGTFINNSYFPSIGYNSGVEISNNQTRKKHDLPHKRMANPIDSKPDHYQNMFIRDADFITYEAVISTSKDQIAISPGYLQKDWEDNNRRYFHYKMDSKILNFYSFLSARYEIKKDKWKDVDIEIFYHKGHEYNLDRMIKGVKNSLDYFTDNFSPYQHRQVRILEFPRYQTFAQSFPNTIPFSEGIGFIAHVSNDANPDNMDEDFKIDYPFYVTAHEIAHQWFAHQVIGGNVEGSNMLSETLAQYGALMVMEKEYGKNAMKKFLQYEMNNYLRSRSHESEREKPLAFADMGQGYILYRKGAVVMYAIQDYIGEDSLNSAISKYLQKVAFQEPPYTNTLEFLSYVKAATPDSLQYIVHDWFETITTYANKVNDATFVKENDAKYLVEFTVESEKTASDSLGKQTVLPLNDWIEIGVFNHKGETIYLQKHQLNQKVTTFKIPVNKEPHKVGIDPFYKLIDRDLKDNEMKVKLKSS